jgi:hypothetical protein
LVVAKEFCLPVGLAIQIEMNAILNAGFFARGLPVDWG